MSQQSDFLVGMKAVCNVLHVSETTALKWYRELGLLSERVVRMGAVSGLGRVVRLTLGPRSLLGRFVWAAELQVGDFLL